MPLGVYDVISKTHIEGRDTFFRCYYTIGNGNQYYWQDVITHDEYGARKQAIQRASKSHKVNHRKINITAIAVLEEEHEHDD